MSLPPPEPTGSSILHGSSAAKPHPEKGTRHSSTQQTPSSPSSSGTLTLLAYSLLQGEEPWLAASLRPANFLPGLAIGFLLGLLLDLSSSWRHKSSPAPAPSAAPARGSSSKRASGSSFASGGEELKMVLVVRQDLKMGAGKIASQCAHAATGLYAELLSRNRIKETAEHRGIPTFIVADAGRTQVLAGSKTVLAIGPGRKPDIDSVTGKLRLL
ncbi:hypothetical protein U9M48_044615 [Paspalum notatum var. saurae]|uniref:peptidyl-tRNA hydrolase n=1 Tax=Paspalum notatum var. saurae TaxID=547442 RepID=A0AAQ3UX90_PASNO